MMLVVIQCCDVGGDSVVMLVVTLCCDVGGDTVL